MYALSFADPAPYGMGSVAGTLLPELSSGLYEHLTQ